jgi:ribA/ribD-fused uncharacterized protein
VPKFVLFWGHTPAKNGAISKSCFSQWWDGHPFAIDGVTYGTAEHYMMAAKARLFGDNGMLGQILAARTAAEAKNRGRTVEGFDDAHWVKHRWEIVVAGNVAKFGKHEALRTFLAETGRKCSSRQAPATISGGLAWRRPIRRPKTLRPGGGLTCLGLR